MARLSNAYGVSGYEQEIAQIMEKEFKKFKLSVEIDKFGNVIAYNKLGKNPLVLGAHMDEIGLIVKFIDDKGFLRFIKMGGIDDRTLLNQQVVIKTKNGSINGVIGSKPPHIMKTEETKNAVEYKSLFIDIGASSKKEAEEMGVEIGSPICFAATFKRLGKRMAGKALDNRLGCYILLELAKDLPDNVILLGTAQEEVSTFGKGATIAAYNLEPSAFIAVDTCVAGDHPELKPEDSPIAMDSGPAIALIEASGRGNVADKKLVAKLLEIAKKGKHKFQLEVIEGGATDATSVYNVKGGIPSIAICVPTRYIHSTVSVASESDVKATTEFLKDLIKTGV